MPTGPRPGGTRISGAFQIRKAGENSYQIGVPRHLGEQLYEQGRFFVGVLTEEGILFRPLDKLAPDQPLPGWAKNSSGD